MDSGEDKASNVIDMRKFRETGKRVSLAAIQEEKTDNREAALDEVKGRIAEYLANLTKLAEQGRLESIVIVASSTDGPFHMNTIIDPRCSNMTQAYTMAGALDAARLQMLDMSAWAPELLEDGSVFQQDDFSTEFIEEDDE